MPRISLSLLGVTASSLTGTCSAVEEPLSRLSHWASSLKSMAAAWSTHWDRWSHPSHVRIGSMMTSIISRANTVKACVWHLETHQVIILWESMVLTTSFLRATHKATTAATNQTAWRPTPWSMRSTRTTLNSVNRTNSVRTALTWSELIIFSILLQRQKLSRFPEKVQESKNYKRVIQLTQSIALLLRWVTRSTVSQRQFSSLTTWTSFSCNWEAIGTARSSRKQWNRLVSSVNKYTNGSTRWKIHPLGRKWSVHCHLRTSQATFMNFQCSLLPTIMRCRMHQHSSPSLRLRRSSDQVQVISLHQQNKLES